MPSSVIGLGAQRLQKLRLVASFILLFVFTQMAGLVHAEIHAFHDHATSCDIFENLVQPIDKADNYSFSFLKTSFEHASNVELVSVYDAEYQGVFHSRAPPII